MDNNGTDIINRHIIVYRTFCFGFQNTRLLISYKLIDQFLTENLETIFLIDWFLQS